MSLISMHELLRHAEEHHYGVPAINVFHYESVLFAAKAAEEARMPLIIQYFPGLQSHVPLEDMANMIEPVARRASIPIAIHLDHSWTYELVMQGIKAGFPSVMVDGSSLSFDENLRLTLDVTRTAHAMGIDVEAELGHVGSGNNLDDYQDKAHFTDPEAAVMFVEKTGCDSLAVAVGNAHGNYTKLPVLDFERIQQLRKMLSVPLVMHGGSDIPYDQMQKAVQLGMSKFNIATEYQRKFYRETQKILEQSEKPDDYFAMLRKLERPCMDFVRAKIEMLNPNHFSL